MDDKELFRTIAGCFNDCQRANAAHNRCVQTIRKMYLQFPDRVANIVAMMLAKILRVPKKESNVERVIKFVGKLVKDVSIAEERLYKKKGKRISLESQFTQRDESPMQSSAQETPEENVLEQSFRYTTIRFLMRFSEAEDKAVRWRSCQLIGAICSAVADVHMIGPQLKADLVEQMLRRTQDRIPQIRSSAIRVLFFVLNPEVEEDKPIIKEFRRLMENDSHQEVRKVAVQCFPVSGESLNKILKRTRDVNPDVRKTAFRSLSLSTPIIFNEQQLSEALSGGLQDRDEKVQKACLTMVQRWIAEVPLPNVLELLNVVENERTAEIVLQQLFSAAEDMETLKVVPPAADKLDTFTQEQAILWRVSVEPQQGEAEEPSVGLDEIIVLVKKAAASGRHFVLKQLLLASLTLISFSNEFFRREYSRCLRNLLLEESGLTVTAQQLCMDGLAKIHVNESEFLQIMLEILADIVEPLDDEEEEEEEEDEDEDFPSQETAAVATRSSEVHLRALVLVEKILGNTALTADHPGIAGLLQAIIIPAVQHRHLDVRAKGLKCFGLYCLLNMDMAASNLLLFVQAASRDKVPVKIVAAQTLFDFLSRYDPIRLLQQEEDWPREFKLDVLSQAGRDMEESDDQSAATDRRSFTMLTLVKFLRHNDSELRTVAVEGFAKLLLNNFITDPQILSILVTLYFHPATESHCDLVQCLGAFFPAYGLGGAAHQQCLEDCFMPTIRRILTASKYSPLRKVPVDKVALFVLEHLSTSLGKAKSVHHDRLAVELAEELYAMGAYVSEQGKQLCKVVCKQPVCGEDLQLVHRLTTAALRLARRSKDKNLQRSLQSLYKRLAAMCPGGAGTKRLALSDEEPATKKKRKGGEEGELSTHVLQPLYQRSAEEEEESNVSRQPLPPLGKRPVREDSLAKAAKKKKRVTKKAARTAPPLNVHEEQQLDLTAPTEPVTAPAPPGKEVVLAFTGFSEQDPAYNFVNLKKLVTDAKALGARVILGNVIDPCITHMVSPPKRRTMKTLIASLTNKWVVEPLWITKSKAAGALLPEDAFGNRLKERPFRKKTVHISTQFMEENPNRQFTLAIFKTLIADLGGGQIARVPRGADMVLCGKAMKKRHRSDGRYLDWKDWFTLIQPDH